MSLNLFTFLTIINRNSCNNIRGLEIANIHSNISRGIVGCSDKCVVYPSKKLQENCFIDIFTIFDIVTRPFNDIDTSGNEREKRVRRKVAIDGLCSVMRSSK